MSEMKQCPMCANIMKKAGYITPHLNDVPVLVEDILDHLRMYHKKINKNSILISDEKQYNKNNKILIKRIIEMKTKIPVHYCPRCGWRGC